MIRVNSAAAVLFLLCLFALSADEARADTIVLQNVSGVMTFTNYTHGDAGATIFVTANNFSVSARNPEAGGPGPFSGTGSFGGNTVLDLFGGTSTYMGETHLDFIWGVTFDGTNVTGSVSWLDHVTFQRVQFFTFSGTGTLTTEPVTGGAPGATRYTITLNGPATVPEPATLLLLGTGLAGVAFKACRLRRGRALKQR